jgi:ferric-dicitrate binding protein FerR (iron transport regulator)
MAERNSTSRARSGRKTSAVPRQKQIRARRPSATAKSRAAQLALRNSIEAARRRLMRANAVLACVAFAFMYSDQGEEGGIDYADAVGEGRRLVTETIDALDSATLGLR